MNKLKDIREKYPRGKIQLPEDINSVIVKIMKNKCPDLHEKIDFAEKLLREKRAFGKTVVFKKRENKEYEKNFTNYCKSMGISSEIKSDMYEKFISPLLSKTVLSLEHKDGVITKTDLYSMLLWKDDSIMGYTEWSTLNPDVLQRGQ